MQPQNLKYICKSNGFISDLHLLLVDLVTKKKNLLVFIICIHLLKPFQASFSGSGRESGRQKGGFNDECDCGIDNVEIVCHNQYLKLNKR